MGIDFYYGPASAPCRAVLLTAEALGLKLNCKIVNLMEKDQLKPEFVKLNPQHTVPTIDDNGYCLWESRAIITYLANQYGKDDSLYPKDPKQRGIVDQRLYFDIGTLYKAFGECYYPVLFGGGDPDPEKYKKAGEAVELFNKLLENADYAAGNRLTVADLSIVATVSTLDVMGFDLSPYRNVVRWYSKVKETAPGYKELNEKNVLIFKGYADSRRLKK